MKLIKPSFEILPTTGSIVEDIERAARTCYKSEEKIKEGSAEKMVKFLIERNHTAMLEHGTIYLYLYPGTAITGYKYRDNRYSKYVEIRETEKLSPKIHKYITTNYRVLVENGWLDDLQYQCSPTKYHEKRISVRFICDRGITHELVRHRVFSFAQESTRFCNYSKNKFGNELTFIIPCWYNFLEGSYKLFDDGWNIENYQDKCDIIKHSSIEYHFTPNFWCKYTQEYNFLNLLKYSEDTYFELLNGIEDDNNKLVSKQTPQQARSVLPNSLKTELIMTGFVSDWKGFFKLRDNSHAHPQAFELAHPLHEEFKKLNLI